jgi:polar amino acid transport system permease protein
MSGIGPSAVPDLPPPARTPLLGRLRPSGVLVATISTIVVFGAMGFLIVTSPGWPRFQQSFLDSEIFNSSVPTIVPSIWKNIQLFVLAEILILILSLGIAVMRSLPGPAFFPFRLMAVIYVDFFRGLPSILVIFVLGFGIPALRMPGLTNDAFIWGLVSLVIVWSAYVSEVYRAGIEAVHPSQAAAARSLGLSQFQALRFVVLPQAVRRVVPPLLNDFIALQKDTSLVSFIGVIEIFRRTQIDANGSFNFTPYLVCGLVFLLITIPMTRFVDWLAARDRRRQFAGAGAR